MPTQGDTVGPMGRVLRRVGVRSAYQEPRREIAAFMLNRRNPDRRVDAAVAEARVKDYEGAEVPVWLRRDVDIGLAQVHRRVPEGKTTA